MDGKRLIRTIRLCSLLSYGPDGVEVELQPLNVLIGPNATGKSNLIEAISLLKAAPKDLTAPIRQGGGIAEWLWKGPGATPTAEIDVTVYHPERPMPLRYRVALASVGQRLEIADEAVENEQRTNVRGRDVYFFYRYQNGHPTFHVQTKPGAQVGDEQGRKKRLLRREELNLEQSVLSQRKDPDQYPKLTYLGDQFGRIRFYREWNLGRDAAPRRPQGADLPEDFLEENAINLGLVLNDLQHRPGAKQTLIENLRKFYEAVDDITTRIHGGTVQVFLHERGLNEPVPATRLSDGTLRYLCLLAILCHPSPPPLICIEEPELGLHPDILPSIAELLIDASQRTQLVVTTHSDALVSALSDVPECVLVCEHDERGTRIERLSAANLEEWLKKYTLGELWRMGEIGGTRW